MSFLGSLHEGCTAAELNVGPGGDEEVSDVKEPSTAGQGQGGLLGLLSLGVDVGICGMSQVVRKPVFGFLTRSDAYRAVQPQNLARGLKFQIQEGIVLSM